jgi:Flp pilus assembly pilin Flp
MQVLRWITGLFPKWQAIIQYITTIATWLDRNIDGVPDTSDLVQKWKNGKAAQKSRVVLTFVSRFGTWLDKTFNDFPQASQSVKPGGRDG